MSNKYCYILSVLLTGTMLLTACLPSQRNVGDTPAATPTIAPLQPTIVPSAIASPVQPTTAPVATFATVQTTSAAGEITHSGDLCEGTGGIGQISSISVGNNEFTIKRNDDGSDLVIHLPGQATIKTSAGPTTLSDLKIGFMVTLAGSRNPDNSFTANIVVVCNGAVP